MGIVTLGYYYYYYSSFCVFLSFGSIPRFQQCVETLANLRGYRLKPFLAQEEPGKNHLIPELSARLHRIIPTML